jgi:ubiquitin-like protein Pup
MSKQVRKGDKKKDADKKEADVASNPEVTEKGKKLKEDMDKLMDEIDDVLEENAEEFVKNYVQKGGE